MIDKYKLLFKLIQAGTLGEKPEVSEKFGIEISELARKNGVLNIIVPVLKQCFDAGLFDVSAEYMNALIYELSARVTQYSKKQYVVSGIIKKLETEGIQCIMLKGDTLGIMYSRPDLRMSNDTDLLIAEKDERKCLKFFEAEGAYVKKRTPSNNQSVVVHPKGGTFEIHVSMDTKQVSEVWYDNISLSSEPYREITTGGGYTYKTLGYTDGAINLALHFVKHFVGGIAHVRMLTDTLLYFHTYKDKVDFERFWNVINHLKYTKIIESIMYIGNKYFGFSNIDCKEEYGESADRLISDIAVCCDYGFDKLEASGGIYSEYSKRRFSTFMKGDYKKYQRNILFGDAYSLIFKNKYEMMQLYPILLKHRWLLPFMYCRRAFECLKNTLFGRKENPKEKHDEKLDTLLNERMKLIDEFDMV